MHKSCTKLSGDLGSAIRGAGIDDHDFLGQFSDTGEAAA